VKPLILLAEKNDPKAFTRNDFIDIALFSESGLAEYMAGGLGGRILWCEPAGWLIYDDSTGAFTENHAEDAIYELVKVYREKILSLIQRLDRGDQDSGFRFYKTLLNANTTRAVIALLRHEGAVTAVPTDFDCDIDLINCFGVAVSSNGAMRSSTPEDRFTMTTACRPEPGIPENFMAFIDWAACGDSESKDWILTAFGVALFGHPTDRIINLFGGGRNGKGAALRTLFKVMKTYAAVLPRTLAIKEPYTSSRFDREGLVGKRLAILPDLKLESKSKLNLDELKTLVGNGDPQSVEPKGKKRFDAVICCKIFLASNEKIPVDSFGESERERFFLVPFDNHIETKDETLEDRFVPEYGKILNLFIEYAVRYFQNGRKMPHCTKIDRATDQYFNSQDLVGQFISDVCETGEGKFTSKRELYEKFTKWCKYEQAIAQPISPKTFFKALEKRGFYEIVKKVDGKTRRVLTGLVTRLQENPESGLPPYASMYINPNPKNEIVCNRVTETPEKTGPGEAISGVYSSPEQQQLWENSETVLF
jgi:P4 family phage/plasmid primase-like protien